jgi:aspartate/methionine/tyrosine aminotransferase
LGWGEPHFATPQPVVTALHAAVDAGKTKYTESAGIEPLREQIAEKLRSENNLNASPGEIVVTPGAKQALFIVITAVVDAGDEIILPNPAWTSYAKMIELAGANPIQIAGQPENRFVPTERQFREAVTPDTKAVIVNTPGNPTGAVLRESELESIAAVAIENELIVIADEVYEHYTFDGRSHLSMGAVNKMRDRTITINGLSKSHAMTGWRLGYLHAIPEIQTVSLRVNQHVNTCATTFVQHAAVEAFDATDHLDEVANTYEKNRDIFIDAVPFPTVTPEGAFYCLLDVRNYTNDEREFAKRLLEQTNVALTPGQTYGSAATGFLRASLALKTEQIREAAERLAAWNRKQ